MEHLCSGGDIHQVKGTEWNAYVQQTTNNKGANKIIKHLLELYVNSSPLFYRDHFGMRFKPIFLHHRPQEIFTWA
jgi:hypothetical protein